MNQHAPDRELDRRGGVALWVVTLLALASARIPYLISPLYLLDNDEAVLGIMARRMAAGSEWPLFFAGQNYGLSVFETFPAAVAFRLFGDTGLVLALTMLCLYLAGLLFYASAFRRLSGSRAWAWALTVVLALIPGWIVWSTKARGLYVSGFVLTGVTLALLTRRDLSRPGLLGAGALMGIVALIQPLWLVVTAPFLMLVEEGRRRVALAVLLAVAIWAVPTLLTFGRAAHWRPDLVGDPALRFEVIPAVLTRAFSGNVWPADPDLVVSAVGAAGAVAFTLLLIAVLLDAIRRRSRLALAVGVGMFASVLHVTVLRVWVPRYFLPSTVLAVVAAAAWIRSRSLPWRGAPAMAAWIVVATLGFTSLRVGRPDPGSALAEVSARDDMDLLLRGLEADGVAGVYATPGGLHWQILFYGRSRIPARGVSSTDRYPELPRAVAEVRRAGKPTAFVADVRGLRDQLGGLAEFPGYRVGERYLRLDEPPPFILALLDFEPDPE